MDIKSLSDLELDEAIGKAKQDSPEMDALMEESYKRHKEKVAKIPLEERKRRSYERFVLHAEDVEWLTPPKKRKQ